MVKNEAILTLRMNGEERTFTQDFIPLKHRIDYVRGEKELMEQVDEHGNPVYASQDEMLEFQAKFVAKVFDAKEVTATSILNGLDTNDTQLTDIILFRIMGVDRSAFSDDEKKEQ